MASLTKHVHVLDTGVSTIDEHVLLSNCGEFGKAVRIPILAYLIKTEDATILVDTSFGNADRADLKSAGYERPLGKGQELLVQLKRLGVYPDGIDFIVNTHLHEDHCGNNKLFKNSTFLVQKEELRHAFVPDDNERDSNGPFYKRIDFDYPLNYDPITGDYDVTKGVQIVSTPGHTAGHQSVRIELTERNFVIASDAVFTEENWKNGTLPGLLYDSTSYMNSIRKLKSIKNAFIYFSHDMDFFNRSPREFS
jgi:glyoxylase-like metal-dependent hydrolase (beta-lactamase superfamily II)